MIDSEFDECFFESAEEQRKFKKRVSDAIAEMPVEPDQFAQDWRAQLDLENKLYEELVAECPREVEYFFFSDSSINAHVFMPISDANFSF
jgi:hypothetical protein